MIANAKTMRQAAVCACTAKFLSLLPQIQEQARFAFRHTGAEQRQELIAEVVANCWAAFVRLVDRGLMDAPETPEGYLQHPCWWLRSLFSPWRIVPKRRRDIVLVVLFVRQKTIAKRRRQIS